VYTYTLEEVKALMCDWEILELKKKHIFQYKIPEYKEHRYVKEDIFKDVSPELLEQLESELGWHTLIRAKLPQTEYQSNGIKH
jgi:hypothetical protein